MLGSKSAPKLVNVWNPVFSSLEVLQVPLESRLQFFIIVLGAHKTRDVFQTVKSHFLQMLLFSTLGLLMSFLGPSWHIMALLKSKIAPNMDPKRRPQIMKKTKNASCLLHF